MTKASQALLTGIEPQEIVEQLNRLYAYEMLAMNWAIVVGHQLEGTALLILQAEIDTQESLERATEIARRIGQLDGELVAHPKHFLEQASISRYLLPQNYSDMADILQVALTYDRRSFRSITTWSLSWKRKTASHHSWQWDCSNSMSFVRMIWKHLL